MFGFAVFGVGSIVTCYILKYELIKKLVVSCAHDHYKFNFIKYDIQGRIPSLLHLPEPLIMSIPGFNLIYMFDTVCDIVFNYDEVVDNLLSDNHIEVMNKDEVAFFAKNPNFNTAKQIAYNSLANKANLEAMNNVKNTVNESLCVEIDLITSTQTKSVVYFHYDENHSIVLEKIEGELIKYDDDLIIDIINQMVNGNMTFKIPPEKFLASERKQSLINLHDSLVNLRDKKIDMELDEVYKNITSKIKTKKKKHK